MIAVISGTTRRRSPALYIAHQLVDQLREMQEPARCIDLSQLPDAAFGPDAWEARPPAFVPEERVLLAARGLIVVVEARGGAMPGELKLFLDLVRYPELFVHLPCAFVGAGLGDDDWGTMRAVEQAEMTLHHRGTHLYGSRLLMRQVEHIVDEHGRIPDAARRARLEKLARGFAAFVSVLRRKPMHTEESVPTVIAAAAN